MKVVVAMDSMKGSLSSLEAGNAVSDISPEWRIFIIQITHTLSFPLSAKKGRCLKHLPYV